MARVGYARVSTTDQDLSTQVERLKAAGCEIIRSEKITGTTRQGRAELASVIEFLRRGDELVVTRIDRLARSTGDLQDIVRELKRRGAFLRAADQPIDTSTAAGKAFLDMLGVFAELKPTSDVNGSWKGLLERRRTGSTGEANDGSIGRPFGSCGKGEWVQLRSARRSGSHGCTSIEF